MANFRPKEVFQLAREAEKKGDGKKAAHHYAALAAYLVRRGKKDEALTLIRRAVSLAPQVVRLHVQHAICASLNGDTHEAENAMRLFTNVVIDQEQIEKYRAWLETELEEYPKLRQIFFERILQLDRTGAEAFLGRARALRAQGNEAGALKVLVEAMQTGTMQEAVLGELEDLFRSRSASEALVHLGRFQEGKISRDNFLVLLKGAMREEGSVSRTFESSVAEKPLRALIEELEKEIGQEAAHPDDEVAPLLKEFRRRSQPILGSDGKARIDMGLAFFEMGLVKEAQEELAQVQETDSLYAEAQALLGDIAFQLGSHLQALEAYQRSLRSDKKTREVENEARYKLVQVFFRLGDLRQAFSQAAELEKLAPSYRDLRLIKNQIEEALSGSGLSKKGSGK